MSFLHVFSRRLPIASITRVDQEFGMRDNAWSGTPRVNARARKRRWNFSTPPLASADAELWMQVLRGLLCHGMPFDTARDVYTSKGVAPTVTSTSGGIESGVASDSTPVYLRDTANNISRLINQYQTGVGFACRAVTNLLTANQSNVDTNTTGFTSVDAAALTRVTGAGQFVYGSGGLQCVTNGAGAVRGGFYVECTATASTPHSASVYLRAASGSPVVRVTLLNVTTAASVSRTSITLATDRWIRVPLSNLAVTAGNTLRLYVEEETIDSAITFYADCLQVEANTHSTSWITGGTTDHGGQILYSPTLLRKISPIDRGLTVGFWVLPMSPGGTDSGTIFEFDDGAGANYLKVTYITAGSVTTQCRGASSAQTASYATTFGRLWTHVIASLDYDNNLLRLFVGGTQQASAAITASHKPDTTLATRFCVGGSADGTAFANAYFSDFFVLPFGISDATDLYAYAQVGQLSLLPRLLISGDVLSNTGDSRIVAIGDVESAEYLKMQVSGAIDNRARRLTGSIQEV